MRGWNDPGASPGAWCKRLQLMTRGGATTKGPIDELKNKKSDVLLHGKRYDDRLRLARATLRLAMHRDSCVGSPSIC